MATFIFSPCEKPCVRRSASASRPSARDAASSTRASSSAPVEAVQRAVVADVLARGEARIEAARIRQHADALRARRSDRARRRGRRWSRSPVGHDQRGQHAQQRRLAGAVGPEQAGDLAVRRDERHVAHGVHLAHACRRTWTRASTRIMAAAPAGPATAAAHGFARNARCTIRTACRSRLPRRTTRPDADRTRGATRCGRSRVATMCRLLASVFATSAPYAGGVTGSRPPDKSSTGLSLTTGCAKSRGHAALRPHVAHPSDIVGEPARAQPGERLRPDVRRDARHVLGAGDGEVQCGVQLFGKVGVRRAASPRAAGRSRRRPRAPASRAAGSTIPARRVRGCSAPSTTSNVM